jgi:acyl CoA:acetate/3-ketoacid CoA transferase alpha subunit
MPAAAASRYPLEHAPPSPEAPVNLSLTFVSYRCALPEPTLLNIANAAERIGASFGNNNPAAIHPPDESRDGHWFDIEVNRSAVDGLPDALRAAGFRHPQLLTGALAVRAAAPQVARAVPAADMEKAKPLSANSVRVRIIIDPSKASDPER